MAATTHQNGLSADDRSDIRSTILSARSTLEEEFERQLERYGIYDDDRVPVNSLSHLSVEDIATRKEIDAALERELEATDGLYGRAYQNYIREATKEYLNRFVGMKTIEARELVTETLRRRPEYGGRSYMHYTVDEIAGELTDATDDGLGAALDLAYQEIGSEIRVLFDGSDYTALEPDFAIRREILEELDKLGDDVWQSDEAMGWVYQFFGENEREEIDQRINDENYKVQDTDVATKTQLFTPRYIVEWMVDNSLGRLWLEMHGDKTNIDDEDKCFHLAPLEKSLIDRDVKDVREIKVLDPACGSGHMLFYAFDVLYEMYLEQSDIPESHIPREILKQNLYGVDIDEGAAQIAALALYVKAKSHAPEVAIEGMNIVSANAVLINGDKKRQVLERADSELERRVLEQVWASFEHIREWGSLVRIEEQIEAIIEEEIEEVKATGQTRFTHDGLAKQSSVMSYSGEEESWEQVKVGLLEQVTALAEEALEQNDPIEELFANEVEKSVQLVDLFLHKYDIVISNPPYLGSGKMSESLKEYVYDNYPDSKSDVYGAFIERCWDFSKEDGYATLVTPENFMFQYHFRNLRSTLIDNVEVIEGAHLSGYSFSMKDRPFTIPFVIRNSAPSDLAKSRFYRLTHEQVEYSGYEEKIDGLTEVTKSLRQGRNHEDVTVVNQRNFKKIRRSPFVYWFGNDILNLFSEHHQLGDVYDVVKGLETGDDDTYTRNWWEVPENRIGEKYAWLMHGGDYNRYHDSTEKLVLWENDGKEIKEFGKSYPRNTDYYRKHGITFRRLSKYFTARIHRENHLFSHAAHFIHTGDEDTDLSLLGYLNSSLVRYIMNGINPGIDFQVGDAKNIPVKDDHVSRKLTALSTYGIQAQTQKFRTIESKYEFDSSNFIDSSEDLLFLHDVLESDIEIVSGLIDKAVFEEYAIPDSVRRKLYEDLPSNLAVLPHIANAGELETGEKPFREHVDVEKLSDKEYERLLSEIESADEEDVRSLAEKLNVSPYTIAMARRNHSLYSNDRVKESAGRLLSYYFGVLFKRWDNLENQITPTEDGILVFDNQFDNNVTDRIRECIEATFDDVYEKEAEIEELLNKDMTDWLRENFFRYHHTKEYRRRGQRIPIYWHLESNDGAFSCFLYYHAMDADTLPKLRGQYVDAKIETLENRLESIESRLDRAGGDQQRELNTELEEVQEQLDDIRDFGDRLDELIDDGFEPDFEAGIWENIQKVDEYDLLQTELDKL
ncbi:BREX-1 system adenine-specific DNA-methyltransferase PglX [Natronosalvus halobius]|uniref:BREX-1 system adenine-specific DNA-methyltransferase PglX n=1 Tax=Natronosalvus halobius TaxID=2953746 RepID=UPI0020A0462E|nr:BREX-1 system adenine-specific DNA-methyltransferase PglX [Natronosalvus halobius]USZ70520.1 BREX-1 system adenine-specific DNA-methyltransferase PglX [Natronosalvus halobius]